VTVHFRESMQIVSQRSYNNVFAFYFFIFFTEMLFSESLSRFNLSLFVKEMTLDSFNLI
jgi:hypothetical protein